MPIVAGVDLSTQSTKVEVRDADTGKVLAAGRAPNPAVQPPRSEQDPAAWWAAFEQAWAEAGAPTVDAIAATSSTGKPSPHNTTSLPSRASGTADRSTVTMSIDTRPAIGTRFPQTNTGVPFGAIRG